MWSKLLLSILIINIKCLFDKAEYIKSFTDVNKLQEQLDLTGKISLILIYSNGCPHCQRFEPEFIKLSEKYNKNFDFYVVPSKSNFREKFDIRGVPTMFYYVGNNFIEHKGRNNFETISYILENNYSKKCKEIELEYFINLNNEKSEKNYILGYFPDEDIISNDKENSDIKKLIIKESFNNFINNTNQMISHMDNCYYIRNLNRINENKEENLFEGLSEGTIIIFSENKGLNIFNEYNNIFISNLDQNKSYYEKRIKDIGDLYLKFLTEKILDYYIDITDSKMVSKLTMFVKRSILLFVYKNDEEKNEFKRKINIIIGYTKNEKYPLFDYVLFKYGTNLYTLSYYIEESGIYYIDKDFRKVSKKIDLDVIINMIKAQNEYEYNPEELSKTNDESDIKNNTNNSSDELKEKQNEESFYDKIRDEIIEKQLINYLNRKNEEALINPRKLNSAYCFILCLIIYSLAFNYINQKLFHGQSIFCIFNDCIYFIKLAICDYDEEELNIKGNKLSSSQ